MFDRYEEFLKIHQLVHKANIDYRENPSRYNVSKLKEELNDVNSMKDISEQIILEEIDLFVKYYSGEYTDILNTYISFIKSINMKETDKLNSYLAPLNNNHN
jgi:hypothetical protein